MTAPKKRFGEILIDVEILQQSQLDEILKIQAEHPYRTFGEIVSTTYGIPMETIESIFVQHVLIPSIKEIFIEHLKKEEEKFSSDIPIQVDQLLYDIDIDTVTLKRTIDTTFASTETGELTLIPEDRRSSTEVGGDLKITIRTQDAETVSQRDKQAFIYLSETGQVLLKGSLLDGIKFQYSQKNKEKMGEELIFNPVTEQEMRDVLEQL